jgi:hypothetical protein
MARAVTWCCLCAALLPAVGCQPTPATQQAPQPVARIDAIELRAMPNALNWDEDAGPDGLRAEVFCYRVDRPQPAPVEGMMEFLIYEGRVRRSALGSTEPFHVWRFTAAELRPCLVRRMGLWGYVVQLGWGAHVPSASSVTLVARHVPPQGRPVHSAPISIAMGAQ